MCLFMWQRGAFEGVATEPTFITLSTIFSYPLGRFSIYTADFTVLLSFCLIYTFFFPRGGVIFRNFPASCTIIAIVAPCRNRGRPRWNVARKVDDKLPIDCSSPSVSFYLYVVLKFPAKIVMENELSILWKLFVLRISIDWKIWKRMII